VTYQSAERVQNAEGRQYHIGCAPGDVAEHILLVGDPERADRVAERFDTRRFHTAHREYRVHTGSHRGLEVSVVCVGMGSGSMEIAVVELCQITQAPTLLRVGSSGALQPEIDLGDLIISQGALRMEQASLGYVDPGFPAFAHAEVVIALCRAADELGHAHHVGVTATASGFYGSQGREVPGFLPRDPDVLDRLARQGVKNLEMETSCLLTLAAVRGVRAGAVCAAFANRPRNQFIDEADMGLAEQRSIDVGLTALHHLARMRAEAADKPHWHHGLSSA
jgi:uridine phosphorylase